MRLAIPLSPSRTALAAAALLTLALAGCSPQDDDSASGTPSSGASSATSTGATTGATTAASCAAASLPTRTAGKLTVGTDNPAYDPWFSDDKPANGKGYESAVAYAVAKQLGYAQNQVVWQTVPFNSAFSPGAKNFDFDINQMSCHSPSTSA